VLKRTLSFDLTGVRVAVNIFVAGTLLWLILREFQQLNPIWAISSMIAASDPVVETAWKFLRGLLTNALVGCGTGLVILFVGGTSEWKVPIALSVSVLISTYVVRVPVMWRQAPITATIVVAGGLADPSRVYGMRQGAERVGDVLLGCLVGFMVSFVMSRFWPATDEEGAD
jgi:uncharacterized membrane protein YccC